MANPEEVYTYLEKSDIGDISYSANATPIPEEALAAVAKMKEIIKNKERG